MADLKILFYAINGTGLGHLQRQLNIARKLRTISQALDLKTRIQFITTSEASHFAWDFPVYKIPSKTIFKENDYSPKEYVASAKLLVSNLVASFRPDVLVLDTVPEGAFHEFLFLKDYAHKTVFIDRHRKKEKALANLHQGHLGLYDLILIPDESSQKDEYPLKRELQAKRRFVGKIHGFNVDEALSKSDVRAYFNLQADQKFVYISAGGGGDKNVHSELEWLIESLLQIPEVVLLVAYGPLYRGPKVYNERVIPYSDPQGSQYFKGFDLAVCAAGYNTYEELLAAHVPSIFYPQEKGLDDQARRIQQGAEGGLNLFLEIKDTLTLLNMANDLLHNEDGLAIRENLIARQSGEGSLQGAAEILKLALSEKKFPGYRDDVCATIADMQAWSISESDYLALAPLERAWSKTILSEYNYHEYRQRKINQPADHEGLDVSFEWIKTLRELQLSLDVDLVSWCRFIEFLLDDVNAPDKAQRIFFDICDTYISAFDEEAWEYLLMMKVAVFKKDAMVLFKDSLDFIESNPDQFCEKLQNIPRGHKIKNIKTLIDS